MLHDFAKQIINYLARPLETRMPQNAHPTILELTLIRVGERIRR
jgi:hypothetical protein